MDARIRQRRAEVRQAALRRRRRLLGAALMLVVVAGAAVGITRSPLFAITAVRVEGVKGEQALQVRDAAQVRTRQNLMTADLDDALARTLQIPWVARAEVRREPPSTVVLAVTPRRPAAIIEVADTTWIVDPTGVVIAEGNGNNLPTITLSVPVAPIPGQLLGDAAARNALDLHSVLPPDVRRATASLEAVGARTVRVELVPHELREPRGFAPAKRVWVRMGSAGDVGEQVAVLRALLEQRRSQKLPLPTEIDVRVPGNPVVIP
jgi:cell division protein FtsQ